MIVWHCASVFDTGMVSCTKIEDEEEDCDYGCTTRVYFHHSAVVFGDTSQLHECVRLDALPPEIQETLLTTAGLRACPQSDWGLRRLRVSSGLL